MGSVPTLDALTVREIPAVPTTPIVPTVVDSSSIWANTSVSLISLSFLNFSLDDLMTRVLFPTKSKWQTINSASVRSNHTSLFKSVETTFYETLKNCMDTIMTEEHVPNEL